MVDRVAGEFERACRVDRFFLSLSQCEITAATPQKPQPDSIDFQSSGGAFQRSITQEIAVPARSSDGFQPVAQRVVIAAFETPLLPLAFPGFDQVL